MSGVMYIGRKETIKTNYSSGNPYFELEIGTVSKNEKRNSTELQWVLYACSNAEKEVEIFEYNVVLRVLDEYDAIKKDQDYTEFWKSSTSTGNPYLDTPPIKVSGTKELKRGTIEVAHDFTGKLNTFSFRIEGRIKCHKYPNASNKGDLVVKDFQSGNPEGKAEKREFEPIDISAGLSIVSKENEFGKTWSVKGTFTPEQAQSVKGADTKTIEKNYGYHIWYRYENDYETVVRQEKTIFSGTTTGFNIPIKECFPTKTDGKIIWYIETKSAHSSFTGKIGETKQFEYNIHVPDSVIPTITDIRKKDMTSNTTVQNWNVAVESFSDLELSVDASGIYGSAIKKIIINGDVPEVTAADTTRGTARTGVLGAGEKTFNAYCIDARGRRSVKKTLKVNVFPYAVPKISKFQVNRDINTGIVTVIADWDWSSVDNKNKAATSLFYKTMTGGWQMYPANINKNADTVLQGTFPVKDAYYFQFAVKDSIGNTTYHTIKLANSPKMFNLLPNNSGIGIGKKCEAEGMEIAFNTTFFGSIELFNEQGEKVTLEQYIRDIVGKA